MDEVKIAAIVPYQIFPPKMGGQKGIALFYRHLAQLIPVHIITTPSNNEALESGMTFHFLLKSSQKRYLDFTAFFRIRKMIRKNSITHIVLEHPYLGWLGILLRWSTGVKLIIHSHNIEGLRFRSTGKWWWGILWNYERIVHRQADHNFFVTEEDMYYALEKFKLKKSDCSVITYGIETDTIPAPATRSESKSKICQRHYIPPENMILLFNGTLDYKPNETALEIIVSSILPSVLTSSEHTFTILICGKNLPEKFNRFNGMKGIIYAGFVDDIENYFLGSDIFINPVMEGGGIKTKLVEALAWGLTCISTKDGAIGIPPSLTGEKLITVQNGDWPTFNRETLKAAKKTASVLPENYFHHFYWGHIAKKALASIRNCQ